VSFVAARALAVWWLMGCAEDELEPSPLPVAG
jgi:hypothetical protein